MLEGLARASIGTCLSPFESTLLLISALDEHARRLWRPSRNPGAIRRVSDWAEWGPEMVDLRTMRHLLTVTLATALAVPALAEAAQAPPAAVQAAIDCRKLSDNQARLACYDAAVDSLGRQLAEGQVVAVDRAQVREVRKQAFGFALPSLNLFNRGGDKPDDIDEVELAVESARRGPDGKWLLRLEGGQVWRQIDTADFSRDPKPGSRARIKKAVLGSYMMMIGGKMPVRVHRDE